jgi:hypothetical protein
MKTTFKLLLAAGAMTALFAAAPAMAQPTSFSFRVGDVAIGYNDGYYDRDHNWHRWHNWREQNWYRAHYVDNYRDRRHSWRGWQYDSDRDGVPNRFDRDRDNDGTPNWRDRHPDNPYRN